MTSQSQSDDFSFVNPGPATGENGPAFPGNVEEGFTFASEPQPLDQIPGVIDSNSTVRGNVEEGLTFATEPQPLAEILGPVDTATTNENETGGDFTFVRGQMTYDNQSIDNLETSFGAIQDWNWDSLGMNPINHFLPPVPEGLPSSTPIIPGAFIVEDQLEMIPALPGSVGGQVPLKQILEHGIATRVSIPGSSHLPSIPNMYLSGIHAWDDVAEPHPSEIVFRLEDLHVSSPLSGDNAVPIAPYDDAVLVEIPADPSTERLPNLAFPLSSEESGDDTDGQGHAHVHQTLRQAGLGTSRHPERAKRPKRTLPKLQLGTRSDFNALLRQAIDLAEDEEGDFLPCRRSPETLELQRSIREHTKALLKIGTLHSTSGELHEFTFLDPKESKQFEEDDRTRPGPSVDRFQIDLVSTKSKWNKRLAVVFASDFIACGRYGCQEKDLDKIRKMFLVHLKTLRREIIESQGEDVLDKLDKAKYVARDMRRRNLMNRRRNICQTYSKDPTMAACYDILRRLRHTVCSGDETAHDGGKVRYAIVNPTWRAPILHYSFRVLDRLHLSTRFTQDNRATRGAFPHIRVPTKRRDDSGPPKSIPRNFFAPEYLSRLQDFEILMLNVQPSVRILFSSRMLRLSERFSRVTGRNTLPKPPNDPSLSNFQQDICFLEPDSAIAEDVAETARSSITPFQAPR